MPITAQHSPDEIQTFWDRADTENRDLTAEDRIELSELVVQAKSQDQIAKQIRDSGGGAGHGLRGLPFPLPVR